MEPLQEQSEQMRERVDGLLNALKKVPCSFCLQLEVSSMLAPACC